MGRKRRLFLLGCYLHSSNEKRFFVGGRVELSTTLKDDTVKTYAESSNSIYIFIQREQCHRSRRIPFASIQSLTTP